VNVEKTLKNMVKIRNCGAKFFNAGNHEDPEFSISSCVLSDFCIFAAQQSILLYIWLYRTSLKNLFNGYLRLIKNN